MAAVEQNPKQTPHSKTLKIHHASNKPHTNTPIPQNKQLTTREHQFQANSTKNQNQKHTINTETSDSHSRRKQQRRETAGREITRRSRDSELG